MKVKTKFRTGHDAQRCGFALILTLIIVVLAAITVVAFLSTTTTERTTAAAYGRIDKANLFAEAGVDAAIARVVTEMTYRPYHAIGYRSINTGLNTEVVPVITGPRTTTPATTATYNTAPGPDVYLVSTTGSTSPGDPPGSAAPTSLTATNSVDLNANHLATEPKGWIGSPSSAATPIPYRAPWVDVLRDPTQPVQPDSSLANYNPVIGRYAYWVEDETSKLDISIVGNKDNGGAFQRGDGVDLPTNTPPRLAVNDLDVGALPLISASPLSVGDKPTNQGILNFRSTMPMLDARFLNRVGAGMTADVHETTKFYATVFGLSNDIAGTGRRRVNINALVTNTSDSNQIANNIDDIGYVITGTHLMDGTLGPTVAKNQRVFDGAATTLNALPNFGVRFFTGATPTADQQKMYVERIAASIRDYIDTDSFSTYIDTSDQVISNVKPTFAWKSGSEPRALGKEAIPILQELAWYGYQRTMQNDPTKTRRKYDVDIDFYFEFFNPTTKDFVAPAGAFLKVYNCVQWSAGTYPWVKPPDTEYPIDGVTFPAGATVVLTTETDPSLDPPGLIPASSNVVRLTGGTRNFTGETDELISGAAGLQMQGRAGSSKSTDYSTEAVWGAPNGIYEALGYVASGGDSTNTWNMDGNSSEIGSKTRFVYSYSLRGNDQPSRTGDARSLSEQLSMTGGLSSLGNDQTRFFGNISGNGVIPGTSTFGKAAISFVDTTKWSDYTQALNDAASTAYHVNRDDVMQSIGELGNIYDAARTIANNDGSASPSILRARGGGRTLKIGQPDDLITGARFSSTWFNAAWRLTDLFEAKPISSKVASATTRGKINVNGVLRDSIASDGSVIPSGGAAFRAALRGYNFLTSPNGDAQLSGRALSNSEVDTLVSNLQSYLMANGPLMERGEISQLPFFNTSGLATADDRGREEIFRRVIEMITTRSASFTVYAIGQSVRQDRAGNKTTTGQKRLAITFQLEPLSSTGALLETSTTPFDSVASFRAKRIYAPN